MRTTTELGQCVDVGTPGQPKPRKREWRQAWRRAAGLSEGRGSFLEAGTMIESEPAVEEAALSPEGVGSMRPTCLMPQYTWFIPSKWSPAVQNADLQGIYRAAFVAGVKDAKQAAVAALERARRCGTIRGKYHCHPVE